MSNLHSRQVSSNLCWETASSDTQVLFYQVSTRLGRISLALRQRDLPEAISTPRPVWMEHRWSYLLELAFARSHDDCARQRRDPRSCTRPGHTFQHNRHHVSENRMNLANNSMTKPPLKIGPSKRNNLNSTGSYLITFSGILPRKK